MTRLVILRLLESYFRHRWLYALPLALMIASAGVYLAVTPPRYLAAGTMYVQKQSLLTALTSGNNTFSWTTPSQSGVAELRELMQTDAFVRSAIRQTPLEANMAGGPEQVDETILEFRKSLDFQALGDNLVWVGAIYKDPHTAQQIAQSLMETYVRWKINADQQESVVAQQFFSKIIEPYQADLDRARADMQAYLDKHPDPIRGDRPTDEQLQLKLLQSAVDQAQERLKNAMEKLENARLAQSKSESEVRQNYAVIDAPSLPLKPAFGLRDLLKTVAPFVVVGIILSLTGIVGGALLDRSLRFPIDVDHWLNLPALALAPDSPAEPWKLVRNVNPADKVSYPLLSGLSHVEESPTTDSVPPGDRFKENGGTVHLDAAAVLEMPPGELRYDEVLAKRQYDVRLKMEERSRLLRIAEQSSTPARVRTRASILLRADEDVDDADIAAALHVTTTTVERVCKRFVEGGLDLALSERAPRSNRRS